METVRAKVVEYPLGHSSSASQPVLTLALDGITPLVVSETSVAEARLAGIGTIDRAGYHLLSLVPHEFLQTAPVPGADGLLTIGDGHYVTIRGTPIVQFSYAEPTIPGFRVQAVGKDFDGGSWAVESRPVGEQRYENRLVNLQSHENHPVPASGFVAGFIRGADGKEYIKVLELAHRDGLFRAGAGGPEAVKGTANLTSVDDVAVAADGTVWRASMLGVYHIDAGGRATEGIGPIAQVPCVISNTAALTTRNPRVAPDGTVWFTYLHSLFRVDGQRSVMKLDLPPGLESPSGLTIGRDGSVWFVGFRDGTPSDNGTPSIVRVLL